MYENQHFNKVLHAVTFINFSSIIQNLLQLYPMHALTFLTYLIIIQIQPSLKAELAFFFSHMSQGHNTLPQPGLEPGLSNLEPSALTTGLLKKAVVLVCPQFSGPCMLKVASCTVVQSYGCTVIHPNFFGLMGYYYFV